MRRLESLQVRLFCQHGQLAQLPALVSKLDTYHVTCFQSFRELLASPAFQTKYLDLCVYSKRWTLEDGEIMEAWPLIANLASLKRIEIPGLTSDALRKHGVPPNLEQARFENLEPLAETSQAFHELWTRLAEPLTNCRVSCNLRSESPLPAKDSPAWTCLVQELLFWSLCVGDGRIQFRVRSVDTGAEIEGQKRREIDAILKEARPEFQGISWRPC